MVRLSARARCELALASALMLGSCGGHSSEEAYQLADVARVNAANALRECEYLDARVSDIEYRLDM